MHHIKKEDLQKAWNVLELDEDASFLEIKESYRCLSLKYHPDRGGDESKYKQINQAYKLLTELYMNYRLTMEDLTTFLDNEACYDHYKQFYEDWWGV